MFRNWAICKLLLLAAVISAFGQSPQSTSGAFVRGRVLDVNGAAIVSATVQVVADDRNTIASAETDKTGTFSTAAPGGRYRIVVTAPGFAEQFRTVNLRSGENNLGEITLDILPSTATVTISDSGGYLTRSVTTATRTLTLLHDTPQSISVISAEQIKDQSMQSISDVVNYVPGITSHQGENNRDQLVIRGNSTSADFFVNGVRDDVQYYRDLYNIESVEALKGPNAMVFGRGGGGGVVNRVTKVAAFGRMSQFFVQGGSFRNKRFALDTNQPLNKRIAIRTNGVFEDSGSFRRYVSLRRYGINPTVTILPNAVTRFTASYEHFHDARTADRGIPSYLGRPAAVAIETFFGNPKLSHAQTNVDLASFYFERQFGRFSLHNRMMTGNYDKFYQNFVPGSVNSARTLVAISSYNNSTKRRNIFNQTDGTIALSTGTIRHTIVLGTEFGRQSSRNFRNTGFFNNATTTISVPYDNPLVTTPVTYRQNTTDANNRVEVNLAAAYVQDQIEVTKHLQLLAGVRFDSFGLRFHNARTGEQLSRIDRFVSPRIGIVWKPIQRLSLYGSHSLAFLPSSGDQFSSLTTITQQVKPEEFRNYEMGAKVDVRRSLALTVAAYQQDRTNTRATDPNDPGRILQTGSQRTRGLEVELNGNVNRHWQIAGGYANQDAVITSATTAARAGAEVAQVPHHTFSLWNNYKLTARFSAGLGVIHRSDMYAAIDNTVTLPGNTRADAAFFVILSEKLRLQGNVLNLFNTRYYLNADGNNNISPGSPRGIRIALTARF